MIVYKEGSLFNSEANIMVHSVNCMGVMGAGIALHIKENFPNVYAEYKRLCKAYRKERAKLLGRVQLVALSEENPIPCIANLYGQYDFGNKGIYTDYKAFETGVQTLNKLGLSGYSIAFPHNIGCGLAGGDWNIISKIIENNISPKVDCSIWKLPEWKEDK